MDYKFADVISGCPNAPSPTAAVANAAAAMLAAFFSL